MRGEHAPRGAVIRTLVAAETCHDGEIEATRNSQAGKNLDADLQERGSDEPELCTPQRGAGRAVRRGGSAGGATGLEGQSRRLEGAPTAAILGFGRFFRTQARAVARHPDGFPPFTCAASSRHAAAEPRFRPGPRPETSRTVLARHARGTPHIQPGFANLRWIRLAIDRSGCPAR
jgi:hypothetical protein